MKGRVSELWFLFSEVFFFFLNVSMLSHSCRYRKCQALACEGCQECVCVLIGNLMSVGSLLYSIMFYYDKIKAYISHNAV